MSVGSCRLQDRLILVRNVQEDTIEIVPRFFGRNREPGPVDHFSKCFSRQRKTRWKVAFDDYGEIITRQGRQFEPAASGLDVHPVFSGLQAYLATLGKLTRDIEQKVS